MRQSTLATLALLLVFSAGLRLFRVQERVVWYDESVSLLVARSDVPGVLLAAQDEGLPPLFNLALHFWTRLSGGEVWARLFSVVTGTATVLVVFAIGQLLSGRVAGLVAAALFSLCPLHVWYSQEVRTYSLQTLLVSLSYLFLLLSLERRQPWHWVLYSLTSALSLYTQYTSCLALVAQNLYVLAGLRRDREALKGWVLSQASIAVLFSPWIPSLRRHLSLRLSEFWIPPLTLRDPLDFFSLLSGSLLTGTGARGTSTLLSLLLLGGFTAALLQTRPDRPRAVLLLTWFFVPFFLLLLFSLKQNLFLARAILFIVPAFALILGGGMSLSRTSWTRDSAAVGLGLLALFNLYALWNYYSAENWWVKSPLREMSALVGREFRQGDLVIHFSRFSYRPFQYYLGDRVVQGLIQETENTPALFQVMGDSRLPAEREHFRRIWLVLQHDFQHPGLDLRLLQWMNQHHHRLRIVHDSRNLFVGLYERRSAELVPPQDSPSRP